MCAQLKTNLYFSFPGHLNDVQTFRGMPDLSPEGPLSLPADLHLLADLGYPNHPQLVRPFWRRQIRGTPEERRLMRVANKAQKRERVAVENCFAYLKCYKCISNKARYRRQWLPILVSLCCRLANSSRRLHQNY